jgi:hypothetical protein
MIDMNSIFQGDANQNGSLIRFGEEGLVFADNSLSVTNTKFDNLGIRSSIGIDELTNCSAPVSGVATDTFTNVGTPVNLASCVSTGSPTPGPVAAVPEPPSLWLVASALSGCWWVARRRRR